MRLYYFGVLKRYRFMSSIIKKSISDIRIKFQFELPKGQQWVLRSNFNFTKISSKNNERKENLPLFVSFTEILQNIYVKIYSGKRIKKVLNNRTF